MPDQVGVAGWAVGVLIVLLIVAGALLWARAPWIGGNDSH